MALLTIWTYESDSTLALAQSRLVLGTVGEQAGQSAELGSTVLYINKPIFTLQG